MKRFCSYTILILLFSTKLTTAQDLSQDFKNWYILGVNAKINKKTTLKVNRLNSFDNKPYQMGFNQSTLEVERKINKNWNYGGGYAFSTIIGREKTNYHRFHAFVNHRKKFGKFQMKNEVQLEKYFPILPKFGARAVITNKWSYSNRKWPLRISPYVKNQLYYYQGGTPITYWLAEEDIEVIEGEEIEESVEQSPNGWHRYRFTLGARSKLSKEIALSLFYTRQIEFNTGFAPYRELNVPNRSQTRIKRPFNNYALLGLSIVYTFKTY